MAFDAHANFVLTTVATAPSPATTGTSLTVATGEGASFPAVPFNVTCWPAGSSATSANAEIVRVTNIAGDVLTITRHQEGTSARSIIVGDQIAVTITAKTLTDVEAVADLALAQSTNYAGTNGAITGGSITVNTSGVSVNLPAYLTTAMASNAATISNIKVSAGTLSSNRSDITFSDGSGVSWGLNTNGVITATVKTDYQTSGAYLTTAMASNRGTDFVQATANFNGTNATGTIASNAISVSVAAQTNQTVGLYASSNTYLTSSGTQDARSLTFRGDKSITVGISSGEVLFSVGAYLTTADLSQNSSNYAGTNGAITGGSITVNTSGVSVNLPAYLTTAALSSQTLGFSLSGNTATTNSSRISNGAYALAGGNNVTIQQSNNTVSISVGNYITTARASTDAVGLNTALTANGVAWTVNSSGISLNVPAFLTTAALSSQTLAFSLGGNSGTTNSSQILNSGYVLAGGNNVTINQSNNSVSISAGAINIANSQATYSNSTVNLLEGGGAITIATSAGGQSFKFSVPQTSNITGINGIGISTNGSTITISKEIVSYFENIPLLDAASTTLSASGSVLQVVPFLLPAAMSVGFIRIPVSMSYVSTEVSGLTANSTWTINRSYTDAAVILKQNAGASSLSLVYVTSSSATWVFQNSVGVGANSSRYTVSQNVTYPISGTTSNYATNYAQSSGSLQLSSASLTLFTGARWLDIPFGASLSAGNYWLALGRSTNSASQAGNSDAGKASAGFSYIGVSQNNLTVGFPGAATNSSIQLQPGLGSWSTNAAVMSSSSLQLASVSAMSSGAKPYFQMIRFA